MKRSPLFLDTLYHLPTVQYLLYFKVVGSRSERISDRCDEFINFIKIIIDGSFRTLTQAPLIINIHRG